MRFENQVALKAGLLHRLIGVKTSKRFFSFCKQGESDDH